MNSSCYILLRLKLITRKKNKPVQLLNIKLTTYDEFGQEGVVLTSNRAEIRKSGDIFFKGRNKHSI